MYNFVDINEVSESAFLPSEALQINGEFIENLIPGYRTLQVLGREALSAELTTHETGTSDGSVISSKRYPARYITVKYQLIADSPESFRSAYNQLAGILNVENARLIFNDETDKFFVGTPEEVGEAPGGTNSVVNEFTIYCADPFKYSVIEYEAEPGLVDNSFLIDYHGTYKSFPTLEAEFFDSDENGTMSSIYGDCGYVAFFNEDEKIIQLGDPDETDTEMYPRSQTLVNQKFTTEIAWGTIAETNWATNSGNVISGNCKELGNVAMKPSSYLITTAPSTSGTLLNKKSDTIKPFINYTVSAKTSNRTASSIDVKVTVTADLGGSSTTGSVNITAGAKVTLNSANLYASSESTSSSGTRSGTYYLWDSSVKNGRIRITNQSSNVGKSGQVTGWVNTSDIGAASASSVSIDKSYGLKGGIQFNGGDWNYVTIKSEGVSWSGSSKRTVTMTVKVKNLEADTTLLEDIKFKVERTDEGDDKNKEKDKIGVLDESPCNDLEISVYTAPVPNGYYLAPDTFGTHTGWHGASITRTIPADASGETGAVDFTFSYNQKMAIGNSSSATQEYGLFQALLTDTKGFVVAGVLVKKSTVGNKANVSFYAAGKIIETVTIDLSLRNKYFGDNWAEKGYVSVKTTTITKHGRNIGFNVAGIQGWYSVPELATTKVHKITFQFGKYGTKPELTYNGLFWAKFVKDYCELWKDVPNKFSSNDIVIADCRNGEIYLNNILTPSLGALGNDWENFYLTPGLNQIGFAYSDWVESEYAPKFKIRYREVFI